MTKNDEANAKSEAPAEEESPVVIKEETEDEKQRRLRAGKVSFVVLATHFCVSNGINCLPWQRNALRKWKRWQPNGTQAETMIRLYLGSQSITE